jgi:hypothetical protein
VIADSLARRTFAPSCASFPFPFQGNPERLRQVLQNVAVVCVRYAGERPVHAQLRCCAQEEGAPEGFLYFRAAFTAVGLTITPEEAGSAFQLESCAGLALLVARSVARGLDGDVVLDGHNAKGVCFELHVRLFRPGAPQQQYSPAASPRQRGEGAVASASGSATSPASPSALAPAPPPPSIDLSTKLFEYLVKHSDEVFHAGQCTPQGLHYVRAPRTDELLFFLQMAFLPSFFTALD